MDQKWPEIEKNLEGGETGCQQLDAKMAVNSNLALILEHPMYI